MIDLRYHIVSLVAVFLALGVGVLMGTTVIDQTLVDGLRARQGQYLAERDRVRAERDQLEDVVGDLDRFADEAMPYLVSGRLKGSTVVLITTDGVGSEEWERASRTLAMAGATVGGVVSFQSARLGLSATADAQTLGELVESNGRDVEELRTRMAERLAQELAPERVKAAEGGGVAPGGASGFLANLVREGFAKLELRAPSGSAPVLAPAGSLFLVMGGSEKAEIGVTASETLVLLVRSLVGQGARVAAAESAGSVTPYVVSVRHDGDLAAKCATVDSLGESSGEIALVLALEGLAAGRPGHYGYKDGAQRVLPQPQASGSPR